MGTTRKGVPTPILAVGTPFPYLFEFNKAQDELLGNFMDSEERNPIRPDLQDTTSAVNTIPITY